MQFTCFDNNLENTCVFASTFSLHTASVCLPGPGFMYRMNQVGSAMHCIRDIPVS